MLKFLFPSSIFLSIHLHHDFVSLVTEHLVLEGRQALNS